MPTYQYACTQCDERLEAVQAFTDEPLTECPACQGRLRKVFSAVGVVFKGSGFYKNDSRSAPTGDKAGGEKGDKGDKGGDKGGDKPSRDAGGDKPSGDAPAGTKPSGDKGVAAKAGSAPAAASSSASTAPASKSA